MRLRRAVLLVTALAATAAASTACTSANGTEGKNYVAGDGVVVEIPAGDRKAPVELSGETLTGDDLDLADLRGKVVVVNVWGAWCGDCLKEAPMLVDAAAELPSGTEMLGIDIRDYDKAGPLGFQRNYDVPYPSIYDPGSETLLSIPAPFNPRETPSTVVLDRTGRVAALIRGVLPSKLTLVDLVQSVVDEGA